MLCVKMRAEAGRHNCGSDCPNLTLDSPAPPQPNKGEGTGDGFCCGIGGMARKRGLDGPFRMGDEGRDPWDVYPLSYLKGAGPKIGGEEVVAGPRGGRRTR